MQRGFYGMNCDNSPSFHNGDPNVPGNFQRPPPYRGGGWDMEMMHQQNYMPMSQQMQSQQMQSQQMPPPQQMQRGGMPLPPRIQHELQSMSMSHAQQASAMAMQQQPPPQPSQQQTPQYPQYQQYPGMQPPQMCNGNCGMSLSAINSPHRFVPEMQHLPGTPVCPMKDGVGMPFMPGQPPKPDNMTPSAFCRPRCMKFC